MKHSINPRHNIHKRTKVFNRHYGAFINLPHLRLFDEAFNPVQSLFNRFRVIASNRHQARLFNINHRASLSRNLINSLTALADNGANLVRFHHQFFNLRRIFRNLLAWTRQHRQHMIKDKHPTLM